MVTAAKKKPAPKGRGGIPLNEFLARRQDEAGLKNYELAEKLGYESPNVIAMLRSGNMAFPLNKTGAMAKALGIDPTFLLSKVLEARNPELLEVLESILGNKMVTDLEGQFLQFVRKEVGGVEFNLMSHPELISGMVPLLHKVAEREKELHRASMEAIKRNYKPGPKAAAA